MRKFLQFSPTLSTFRFLAMFLGLLLVDLRRDGQTAAAATWNGSSSSNWNDSLNWDVTPGAGDPLVFSAAGQTFRPTNNDIPGGSFSSLTLNASAFSGGPDLLTITGNSFSLGAGGITATSIGAGRIVDLQTDVNLTASAPIANSAANTMLQISGVVSGAATLTKTGAAHCV